jgi:hypothetical protein
MTPRYDVEPAAALAGALMGIAESARFTGAGTRAVGRRIRRAGTDLGRRTAVSARVFRGGLRTCRRRPGEYVAAGLVAGAVSGVAFTVLALRRAVPRHGDGEHAREHVTAHARHGNTVRSG